MKFVYSVVSTVLLLAAFVIFSHLSLAAPLAQDGGGQKGSGTPLTPGSAAAACDGAPRMVASSNHPGQNMFSSLVLLSDDAIWAGGQYYSPTTGVSQPLLEYWSGREWSDYRLTFAGDTYINSIAAVTANDIWAVGVSNHRTMALHWDGNAWTQVATPSPSTTYLGSNLTGVFAVSANDVWAVGSYNDLPNEPSVASLTIHWDGTAWNLVSSPNPDTSINQLNAITGTSTDDVWAFGTDTIAGVMILHWDGSLWSVVTIANRTDGTLNAAHAVGPDDIWAVGATSIGATLAVHWDGTAWSVVSTPNPPSGLPNPLLSITGNAGNDLWAVGSYTAQSGTYNTQKQVTMHWNGTAWSLTPNTEVGKLMGVAASSSGHVSAVGSSLAPEQTLFTRWNGVTWDNEPSPDPGPSTNTLYAVDAVSANDIWAVGTFDTRLSNGNSMSHRALAQHWDGTSWSDVPAAQPPNGEAVLLAVEALNSNDVWAVGAQGAYYAGDPSLLTEHWNGSTWSIIDTPLVSGESRILHAVAALSAADVWAVGYSTNEGGNGIPQPIILHWNGSAWNLVNNPDLGANGGALTAIAALSPTNIWAVGNSGDFAHQHSLALHWDGSQWAKMPLPAITGNLDFLSSISAVTAGNIWAVGAISLGSTYTMLVLHWDGTSWAQVTVPPLSDLTYLYPTVKALDASHIWITGWYSRNSSYLGTYLLVGNGTDWHFTGVQAPGALVDRLYSVSAVSPTDVWLVGDYSNGVPNRTLIEHIGRYGDVLPTDYFNQAIEYLAVHGVVTGYADCTFHPWSDTTRAQLSKMVALGEGWPLVNPPSATFADVQVSSTFFRYIETMYAHNAITGYACGGTGEPCDPQHRPYFRPNASVTRAQVAKMVTLAEGWPLENPAVPTFVDVEYSSPYYTYVETAHTHGLLAGYACGGTGEPCDSASRPYYRPGNNGTRGQISKILFMAITGP